MMPRTNIRALVIQSADGELAGLPTSHNARNEYIVLEFLGLDVIILVSYTLGGASRL